MTGDVKEWRLVKLPGIICDTGPNLDRWPTVGFQFDRDHDTLHVFRDPLERPVDVFADSTEPTPGVIVRLDDQGEPVGATILGYSKRDKGDLARLVPFEVDWPEQASQK